MNPETDFTPYIWLKDIENGLAVSMMVWKHQGERDDAIMARAMNDARKEVMRATVPQWEVLRRITGQDTFHEMSRVLVRSAARQLTIVDTYALGVPPAPSSVLMDQPTMVAMDLGNGVERFVRSADIHNAPTVQVKPRTTDDYQALGHIPPPPPPPPEEARTAPTDPYTNSNTNWMLR